MTLLRIRSQKAFNVITRLMISCDITADENENADLVLECFQSQDAAECFAA